LVGAREGGNFFEDLQPNFSTRLPPNLSPLTQSPTIHASRVLGVAVPVAARNSILKRFCTAIHRNAQTFPTNPIDAFYARVYVYLPLRLSREALKTSQIN
jgi:hypothetical protein